MQGILAMKDACNENKSVLYGFITIREDWRIVKYDSTFQMTEKFTILFDSMDKDKDRWMKKGPIMVDCINFALSNGGVKQDVDFGW